MHQPLIENPTRETTAAGRWRRRAVVLGMFAVAMLASAIPAHADGPYSGTTAYAEGGVLTCPTYIFTGDPYEISVTIPTVEAVVSNQYVAWIPVLYQWVDGGWQVAAYGEWMWAQVGALPPYAFTYFSTGANGLSQTFTVPNGGYWAVGNWIYWYGTDQVGDGWAFHTSYREFGSTSYYCAS